MTIVAGTRAGDGMSEANRRSALDAYGQRAASCHEGRLVCAENSAHYVPLTDTDLVVAETGRLATAA